MRSSVNCFAAFELFVSFVRFMLFGGVQRILSNGSSAGPDSTLPDVENRDP
jgi:hypothetical protein